MVVCLCKGINERKLSQLAKRGLSLKEIQASCQAGMDCGTCVCQLREIVEQSRTGDDSESA